MSGFFFRVGCDRACGCLRARESDQLKVLPVEAHLKARAAAFFVPAPVSEALLDVHAL